MTDTIRVVPAEQALAARIGRLMLYRVVVIATLLLVTAYVEIRSETIIRVNPLYYLVAGTCALTLGYVLALRLLPYKAMQAFVQILIDLLALTGLVYLTGASGPRAGYLLLYPISVLSGSVILSRVKGLLLAALATMFFALTVSAVRLGLIQPRGLADVLHWPLSQSFSFVVFTGISCAIVALVGSYMSESLQRTGERLEEAAGQVSGLRELNQAIVNSIHSGLLTADDDGRILFVNSHGAAILGIEVPDLAGRRLPDVFQSILFEPSAINARESRRSLQRLEFSYLRPDGQGVELGISVTPLAAGNHRLGRHLLVFQNLTEIKKLEHEVRLKEKLAAVGEMAAHIAHEIRNPLGSISGAAQLLMAEAEVTEDQSRLLGIIKKESKRLSETLNQFLYQTRPAPASVVDLASVIQEAITLLRSGLEPTAGHRVEFGTDGGSFPCLADAGRISQVFWNVARNGLEAMPGGGRLKVELLHESDHGVLAVTDEGRGVGREQQARIFEPFQSGKPGGTGLGLAIVYQIVREHGGDIMFKSQPGGGTTVEIRLPLVAAAVPA